MRSTRKESPWHHDNAQWGTPNHTWGSHDVMWWWSQELKGKRRVRQICRWGWEGSRQSASCIKFLGQRQYSFWRSWESQCGWIPDKRFKILWEENRGGVRASRTCQAALDVWGFIRSAMEGHRGVLSMRWHNQIYIFKISVRPTAS